MGKTTMLAIVVMLLGLTSAQTAGAGSNLLSPSVGRVSVPMNYNVDWFEVDQGSVIALEYREAGSNLVESVVRTSFTTGKRKTIWRNTLIGDFVVRNFAAGGGYVALSVSFYHDGPGRGPIDSKVLRVNEQTGETVEIATAHSPAFEAVSAVDDKIGQFCGDFVDSEDVTDAGEVIVHRLAGSRTGKYCNQDSNTNTEMFDAVSPSGSTTRIFSQSRDVPAPEYGNRSDTPEFISPHWRSRSAGRFVVMSGGDQSYLVNVDNAAQVTQYSLWPTAAKPRNHLALADVNESGQVLINDFWFSDSFGTTTLIKPYFFQVPGDASTKRRFGSAKRSTQALFCGSRVVTFRLTKQQSLAHEPHILLYDVGGSSKEIKFKTRLFAVTACDAGHLFVEVISSSEKYLSRLIAVPLPAA